MKRHKRQFSCLMAFSYYKTCHFLLFSSLPAKTCFLLYLFLPKTYIFKLIFFLKVFFLTLFYLFYKRQTIIQQKMLALQYFIRFFQPVLLQFSRTRLSLDMRLFLLDLPTYPHPDYRCGARDRSVQVEAHRFHSHKSEDTRLGLISPRPELVAMHEAHKSPTWKCCPLTASTHPLNPGWHTGSYSLHQMHTSVCHWRALWAHPLPLAFHWSSTAWTDDLPSADATACAVWMSKHSHLRRKHPRSAVLSI